MYVLHFLYWFICQWTFSLVLAVVKLCFSEHWNVYIFSIYMPRSRTAGSYIVFLFLVFLRNFHSIFCTGCTNLHSHLKGRSVLFSPHPCQHLLSVDLKKIFFCWSIVDDFEIMVLEKTLKSLLHFEDIKLVNPKGKQPWIFIGRTVAKAPVLWPPNMKSQLIGKDPDSGKDWRQNKLQEIVDDRGARHAAVWGHKESDTA